MDIVEALLRHYEVLRDLFETTAREEKRFIDLIRHLDVHNRNEELFFLNRTISNKEITYEALESKEEHHIINIMVNDLIYFPMDDRRWKVRFGILHEFTEHHLKEEEEDLFQQSRQFLNKTELEKLGNAFERNKKTQLSALEWKSL